jgi:hypothetical protein
MAVDIFSIKKVYSFPVMIPVLNRENPGTEVESAICTIMLVKKKEVNSQ